MHLNADLCSMRLPQVPGSRSHGKRLMIPCREFTLADLMDNSSKTFNNCRSILGQHTVCLGVRCHAHEMMLLHVFIRQRDGFHANDSSHSAAPFVIIASGGLVFGCNNSRRLRVGKYAAAIRPERSMCTVTFVCIVTITTVLFDNGFARLVRSTLALYLLNSHQGLYSVVTIA